MFVRSMASTNPSSPCCATTDKERCVRNSHPVHYIADTILHCCADATASTASQKRMHAGANVVHTTAIKMQPSVWEDLAK
jgi:hypothetical protein